MRTLRARPTAPLAAGFVAGIALALLPGAWIPLTAAGALAAALSIRWRHPVLLLILGLGLGGLRQHGADTAPLRPATPDPLEGRVQGPPRITRSLSDPNRDPEEDGTFVVGNVQVRCFRKHVPLIGGERVRVWGKSAPPKPATNPGQFDYAQYLRRQGVDTVLTMQRYEVFDGPPSPFRVRAWFRSLFDQSMRPEVGAFLAGITIGGHEPIPDDLRTNLQQSGTAHLIAISGQNLVIVMMTLWALLTLHGLKGRPLSLLLTLLLGLYTLLTGLEVSVVRSYLMLATFFGADVAWRKRDALSALGLSAILICAADPGQILDVGFQLSFVAVLGLAFISPIFHAFSGAGNAAWNWLRTGMGVSLAAWLGTAPIVGVPPNETSIVLRAANVSFPGDIKERGVEELLTLPDVRARVLLLPHHGKSHRQHRELVQRVAPELILVSAPEGYSSPKVLEALPFAPRLTGRDGALEIELK